jgi:FkbM family methyltransferase
MTLLTVHGVRVPLTSTDVSPEIWRALSNETYEAKEARWVVKSVRPHDRVLELGTGIGILTCLIAGVDGVHVWTFEPSASSVRLAKRVIEANSLKNVTLSQGILAAGPPRELVFYLRKDLWMSSLLEAQGPYYDIVTVRSANIDEFILQHQIDVVVMDIEGAERDLLVHADLPGVKRIFLELHDHLYGLTGIREITSALAAKGFAYDPRGSSGPCVLLSRGDWPREYQPESPDE